MEVEPPRLQGARLGFQQLQQPSLTTNNNNNNSSQPSCSTLNSNQGSHNSNECHSNSSRLYHLKLKHNHKDSSPDNLSLLMFDNNPDNLRLLLFHNNPDNLSLLLFPSISLNLFLLSSRGNPSHSVSSNLNQSELNCPHRLLLLQLVPITSRASMSMILQG